MFFFINRAKGTNRKLRNVFEALRSIRTVIRVGFDALLTGRVARPRGEGSPRDAKEENEREGGRQSGVRRKKSKTQIERPS